MPRDGKEIVSATTRKARTTAIMPTMQSMSAPEIKRFLSKKRTEIGDGSNVIPGGEETVDCLSTNGGMSPSAHEQKTILELVSKFRYRQYYIKSANGVLSQSTHLMARDVGHIVRTPFETDTQAQRTKKEAFAVVDQFRKLIDTEADLTAFLTKYPTLAFHVDEMRNVIRRHAEYEARRSAIEAEMTDLAKQLPIAPFIQDVRGFSFLGLAVIQACAGTSFLDYKSPAALWKRMGVAVIGDVRQQRRAGKRETVEERALYAYSPSRRAELYTFISDTMFRAQWRGERLNCSKCEKPTKIERKGGTVSCGECKTVHAESAIIAAHAIGFYGEVYAQRKRHTLPRIAETAELSQSEKWTPARCENDARRIMSKALLRDIWRVSRGMPPRTLVPD